MANKNLIEDLLAKQDAAEDAMIEANEHLANLKPGTAEYDIANAHYLKWCRVHNDLRMHVEAEYDDASDYATVNGRDEHPGI